MRRCTTPIHKYIFPDNVADYDSIEISYFQEDSTNPLLVLHKNDLTINGKVATYKFTQTQTKLFTIPSGKFGDDAHAYFQVKAEKDDNVGGIDYIPFTIKPMFNLTEL